MSSPTLSLGRHEKVPDERTTFVIDLELPSGEHLLRFEATPEPIGLFPLHVAWSTTDARLRRGTKGVCGNSLPAIYCCSVPNRGDR
jgi:hypothetical protein